MGRTFLERGVRGRQEAAHVVLEEEGGAAQQLCVDPELLLEDQLGVFGRLAAEVYAAQREPVTGGGTQAGHLMWYPTLWMLRSLRHRLVLDG